MTLPWDQVPPERREIGGLADPLDDELGLLNVNLAIWMARDDSKAGASVTRAGNQVLDSIDTMLRQLHQLRARMVADRAALLRNLIPGEHVMPRRGARRGAASAGRGGGSAPRTARRRPARR